MRNGADVHCSVNIKREFNDFILRQRWLLPRKSGNLCTYTYNMSFVWYNNGGINIDLGLLCRFFMGVYSAQDSFFYGCHIFHFPSPSFFFQGEKWKNISRAGSLNHSVVGRIRVRQRWSRLTHLISIFKSKWH